MSRVIGDRYRVLRPLGQGATASVYLVEDLRRGGRRLALKQLTARADLEHLQAEFEALSALGHPNLAAILDLDLGGELPFLTAELVEGADLATWSRGAPRRRILDALAAVLRALCLLHHRGWVHGDLKPTNILVAEETGQPRLVDFGLAARGRGQTGGTAGYAAPEILAGGAGSPRADVYAFAVVALEVLSGQRAFAADAAAAVTRQLAGESILGQIPDLPPPLVRALEACLAPDPARRPASALEVLPDFLAAAGIDPVAFARDTATLPEPALTGRAAALTRIEEALARAAAGEPGALLIHGDPGLGKSRLLREAQLLALRRGFHCLPATNLPDLLAQLTVAARMEEREDPGLRPLLRGLLPLEVPPAPPAATSTAAPRRPGPHAGEPVAPDAAPTSFLPAGALPLPLPPGDAATRRRAALLTLTELAARRRPLLLLLDDAPHLEQGDRGVLEGFSRALALTPADGGPPRVLLLVAARDPARLPSIERIELLPLTSDESQELLRSLMPGLALETPTLVGIWRLAAGNPWLLRESLTTWLQAGDEAQLEALAYPERVLAIARERLTGLPHAARRLLTLAALAPEIDERAARTVVPEIDGAGIRDLLTRRLLVERPGEPAPTLALGGEHLRQVLLAELSTSERADVHRHLARALEAVAGDPAASALHWEGGAERERAAESYWRAARVGFDYRGQWAQRAAELGTPSWPGWLAARRAAARSLIAAAELAAAREQLLAIQDAALAADEDRLLLAQLSVALGDPSRALAALDGLASEGAELIRAQAMLLLGQHEEARACCQRLGASGGRENLLGLLALRRGELERAREHLERAETLFGGVGDGLGLAKTANNLALTHQARGELRDARAWYARAMERSRAIGDPLREVHCRMNHATVCQLAGELARAIGDYRQAIRDARRLGSAPLEAQARINLATLLLEIGDDDGAGAELDACPPASGVSGAFVLMNRADLALGRLQLEEAERLLQEAAALPAVNEDSSAAVELLLVRARLALARGEVPSSMALARQAATRSCAARLDKIADEARLAEMVAARRSPRYSPEEARRTLAGVVRGMEERGERGRLWLAYHELARVEALLGLALEPAFHLAQAREIVEALLADLPTELRECLHRRPDFREVYAATRQLPPSGPLPPAPIGLAGPGAPAVTSADLATSAADPAGALAAADAASLLRITLELARLRDPAELVVLALDKAIELSGAQRGLLILVEGDELRLAAARNMDQESLRSGSELFSTSVAREVIASGQAIVTVDASSDERFLRFASVHQMKLRSVVCAPLKIWGATAGVIYLDHRFRPGAFSLRHIAALESLGAQAGLALDTARLLQERQQQVVDLLEANRKIEELTVELRQTIARQSEELIEAEELVRAQGRQLGGLATFDEIVGRAPPLRRVLEQVAKTAHAEIPIYIYGESGTGKELIARAIHRTSPRREGPMVVVNCGGLPPTLLASELFGHVRGAFTGAVRAHPGLFRMADGGTLFLDEVTEMSPELQVQLLRAVQEGTFRPVGGEKEIEVDVRVLSASNVDLEEAVRAGAFREDLSYRLNVLRLDLPPLRQRREDIPLLARHFLGDRPIHRAALRLLQAHSWPGNVRELANELARASALAEGAIRPEDLSPRLQAANGDVSASRAPGPLDQQLARVERQILQEALTEASGNATAAARLLGLSRAGLYKKLRRHQLQPGPRTLGSPRKRT